MDHCRDVSLHLLDGIMEVIFRAPLRRLYLKGPRIPSILTMGVDVGFWQGMEPAWVCSRLTQQSSEFWIKNAEECQEIIDSKLSAFLLSCESILYFVVLFAILYRGLVRLLQKCFSI